MPNEQIVQHDDEPNEVKPIVASTAPWTVRRVHDDVAPGDALAIDSDDWSQLATVWCSGGVLCDESSANARLIAAAPDLLMSVKEFVALYDGVRNDLGDSVKAKLARAEAAIAKAVGVVLLLFIASTASAEEKTFNWKPVAIFAAGQNVDLWSTRVAMGRGCFEGNPMYGSRQPSVARLAEIKAITILPITGAILVLQAKGHPKIAAALGYGGGAVGFTVGAVNLSCGGRR